MFLQDKKRYSPQSFERRWQEAWEKSSLFRAQDLSHLPKFYCLVEFPYPSGAGLHVGHVRAWAAMDAYVRRKRVQGFNVLYPMGWDAFGLPAENYALKKGGHPSKTVAENVARFKRQCQALGLSFDWSREINTTDPRYYRWTQWIFLQMLKKGLAYRSQVPVNWCPSCRTNLADEEVLPDGTHERCGQPTEKRSQKQWLLRITNYAQRLLDDLALIDFSPKIRRQQENWIGRKEWIDITYPVNGTNEKIIVSTTRPDTNFGATFIVVAPEHSFVTEIIEGKVKVTDSIRENIAKYVQTAKNKSELERISELGKKTGVFTGLYAINQLNKYKIPIWISDFVLTSVGTGVVVGVPGHDARDFEFAKEFNLPIIRVVVGKDGDTSPITRKEQIQEEEGKMINSQFLDGLGINEATKRIMDYLEEKGWGKRTVRYHLRDWVFSRQHYWGEPIPVVYCAGCVGNSSKRSDLRKVGPSKEPQMVTTIENGVEYAIVPVPEDQLPLELPYVEKYQPSGTGESPLANFPEWVNTTCPVCGRQAKRETDTMPNWAGSNWYYLGYLVANSLESQKPAPRSFGVGGSKEGDIFTENKKILDYWMPVDIYEGGFEHTTLHLLYSRFVHKFLYDLGVVPGPEPYTRRRSHGIVLGSDGRKMSKSFDNVVNPDEIVAEYGADTLRLYEMFLGPFDQAVNWNPDSLAGCWRFLGRIFNLAQEKVGEESTPAQLRVSLQKTIKKVDADLENLKFNTAVAALMEFANEWERGHLSKADAATFLKILAPFAPHLAEELWQGLEGRITREPDNQINEKTRSCSSGIWSSGHPPLWSVHQQSWPLYDERLLQEKMVTLVVQVNGKVRERLSLPTGVTEAEAVAAARRSPRLAPYLVRRIERTIFVPDRLLNFVTSS